MGDLKSAFLGKWMELDRLWKMMRVRLFRTGRSFNGGWPPIKQCMTAPACDTKPHSQLKPPPPPTALHTHCTLTTCCRDALSLLPANAALTSIPLGQCRDAERPPRAFQLIVPTAHFERFNTFHYRLRCRMSYLKQYLHIHFGGVGGGDGVKLPL